MVHHLVLEASESSCLIAIRILSFFCGLISITGIYIYACAVQEAMIDPGLNFRFFHTYCEEGAIGLAVALAHETHRTTLEEQLLRKQLLRVETMCLKRAT